MAVPLVLLYTVAAGCCYYAMTIRPSGTWDKNAYAATSLLCFLTIAASTLALLLTVAPASVRRAMGRWWLVPPLVLIAVATVRWMLGS
ncbi:hypothetical protein [Streptomyces sp. NPDC056244]|uniref:hypothetical protein n=1 Tax=Streptomyces sp. NPDC056244 TaxID=3345762 RepID=UPI0035D8017E